MGTARGAVACGQVRVEATLGCRSGVGLAGPEDGCMTVCGGACVWAGRWRRRGPVYTHTSWGHGGSLSEALQSLQFQRPAVPGAQREQEREAGPLTARFTWAVHIAACQPLLQCHHPRRQEAGSRGAPTAAKCPTARSTGSMVRLCVCLRRREAPPGAETTPEFGVLPAGTGLLLGNPVIPIKCASSPKRQRVDAHATQRNPTQPPRAPVPPSRTSSHAH